LKLGPRQAKRIKKQHTVWPKFCSSASICPTAVLAAPFLFAVLQL